MNENKIQSERVKTEVPTQTMVKIEQLRERIWQETGKKEPRLNLFNDSVIAGLPIVTSRYFGTETERSI
jgi:hypothetical protein